MKSKSFRRPAIPREQQGLANYFSDPDSAGEVQRLLSGSFSKSERRACPDWQPLFQTASGTVRLDADTDAANITSHSPAICQ